MQPETAAELKARHLEGLRILGQHAMALAISAAERAAANDRLPEPALKPDHHADFTRHARTVQQIFAIEARLAAESDPAPAAGSAKRTPARPQTLDDPRHPLLRHALHDAARNQQDRTKLCRAIDDRIEAELLDDPDGAVPITELLIAIAGEFGLPVDPARLSDELLAHNAPS